MPLVSFSLPLAAATVYTTASAFATFATTVTAPTASAYPHAIATVAATTTTLILLFLQTLTVVAAYSLMGLLLPLFQLLLLMPQPLLSCAYATLQHTTTIFPYDHRPTCAVI